MVGKQPRGFSLEYPISLWGFFGLSLARCKALEEQGMHTSFLLKEQDNDMWATGGHLSAEAWICT